LIFFVKKTITVSSVGEAVIQSSVLSLNELCKIKINMLTTGGSREKIELN